MIKNAHKTINQRRIDNFKQNRLGHYSLYIFLFLFAASLFSELIANDKPLVVYSQNSIKFPIFFLYTEVDFGGEFELEADYKDPYVKSLIESQGWMIWPLIPFSYDTINYQLKQGAPSPPDQTNILGTDDQGRDVFARVLYGFRVSILFALTLTFFSSIIGVFVGAVQGYFGGKIDLFGQRLLEIWGGLPQLFLLIIFSSFIMPNFWWLLFIMLLFSWTNLVDVVRAEFLRGRNLEYVRSAKALGLGDYYVMFKHILPNAMVATLTFLPFQLSAAITALTALDFLGFGMPAGSPSLGELVAQAKANLSAPWLGLSAFISLSLMLLLLVFIGDALRDAFDPRLEKK